MKLKIFRSFLVAAAFLGSVCGLSSCKDTDQDMNLQLKDENITLSQKLDSEIAILEGKIESLEEANKALKTQLAEAEENCRLAWTAAIEQLRLDIESKNYVTEDELNTRLEQYLTVTEFNNFKAEYDILAGNVANLENTIANIQQVLGDNANGSYETVGERFTAIESAISGLQNTLGTLTTDLGTLQGLVSTMQDELTQTSTDLANTMQDLSNLTADVATLSTSVDNMSIEINNINTSITTINTEISNLKTLVTSVQQTADKAWQQAQTNKTSLTNLSITVSNLSNFVNQIYTELSNKDAELLQKITENVTKINKNAADILQLQNDLATLETTAATNLATAKTELTNMINAVDGRVSVLETSVGTLETKVYDLDQELTALKQRVTDNETAIQGLTTQINDLTGRVDKLEALVDRVSSVVIQQVSNPIIGSVSMPFDMQSMVLFNYWGETTNPVIFPNFVPDIGSNYGGDADLSDYSFFDSADFLNIPTNTKFINDADGNFGKVYFTVNPTNLNMDGKNFTLVNSRDEEIPVVLKNVQPSDKLLSFGISRATASPNGFYEADATVEDANDVQSLRFELESGMKSALKDAVKNRTLSSVADVVYLMYKQFENGIPAYGMKVDWTENGVQQSVHSNYGIAATSFRPLSYSFLDDDFSGHLPDFPSLNSLVDRLHFNMGVPEIHFNYTPIHFTSPTINIELSVNTTFTIDLTDINANVSVNVPEQIVKDQYGNEIGHVEAQTLTGTGLVNLSNLNVELNNQLKDKFANLFSQLSSDLQDNIQTVVDDLVNKINDEIDTQLGQIFDDIEVSVNNSLKDVVNSLQNQVNNKVESIANRIEGYYNKIASVYNRFKDMLSHPNHYLQVMMLYSADNSIGRLSTSKVLPTVLTGSGSALTFIPTTYSFDILSPAYKKYVAVSNVYGPGDTDCSNDATCRAIRDAANAGEYMNTVISGERLTVAFDFSAAANAGGGYTYEIYYQALDYHGYTSTQKFYVKK